MNDLYQSRQAIDTVLLKVASRCNINCTYCYVYNMGDDNWKRLEKFMNSETIEAVTNELAILASQQQEGFNIVLHGGEPLLLGNKRLDNIFDKLRNTFPDTDKFPVSIQTNGMLITNEVVELCFKYSVSMAVSIDGPKDTNDALRIDHKGQGTFDRAIKGLKILSNHSEAKTVYSGLLAVVDPSTNPQEVYDFFKKLRPPSVDFLYKDGNHSRLPTGKNSLMSTEYGQWMKELFLLYIEDNDPVPIRILDDMVKVLLGSTSIKEGMGLTDFGILIIDTDGTLTKNDTLKSSYKGADQFQKPINVRDRQIIDLIQSEEFRQYRNNQRPSCSKCLKCNMLNVCGGGMTLHRWSEANGYDNPSVYCADQMLLVNEIKKKLASYNLIEHE